MDTWNAGPLSRTLWEFGTPSLCPGGYSPPDPSASIPSGKGAVANRRSLEMRNRHLTKDTLIMDTGLGSSASRKPQHFVLG